MEISGNLDVGRMDRELVFQQPTVASDEVGQPINVWTTFATVWGELIPMTANERFRSVGIHSVMTNSFKIYYLQNLVPTMRLSYESKLWQITGISEIGRRDGMLVTVELIE